MYKYFFSKEIQKKGGGVTINNNTVSTESILYILAFFMLVALCVISFLYLRSRKISKSAYTDSFTGGLTENGFHLHCKSVLANRVKQFAVIYMRLPETDSSHIFYGDMKRITGLIFSSIRNQLRSQEIIAPIGDDAFCFLIQNRNSSEIRAKLIAIDKSISACGNSEMPQVRKLLFGVYLPYNDKEPITDMIEKSKVACAGAVPESRISFYNEDCKEEHKRYRDMAIAMRKALSTGEFTVYYQPKVRVSDQRVVGAEALIRWRHPHRGILSPGMFLDVAEHYRLTDQLDRAVFREVCAAAAKRISDGYELCPISVNLSAVTVNVPDIADEFYDICRSFGVNPSSIEFEIKEDTVLKNLSVVTELVKKLHYHGFRCAIDNFGAGSCSLQNLVTTGIDTVKLDSSFFTGENNNRHGRQLIETLLKLSAQLHIHTVAEGIDNSGQIEFLRNAACDTIQGFAYFKPMPVDKFESLAFEGKQLKYVSANVNEAKAPDGKTPQEITGAKNGIILFVYSVPDDTIEFSECFSPILAGDTVLDDAMALFRTTDLIHENDRNDFAELFSRCQRENGWVENTLRFYMSHGRYEWLEVRAHYDPASGTVSGMLADMSGWKNEVNRWKEKATRDALTGLYNRSYFDQTARSILSQGNHEYASIIFVDVDYFKTINDTFGHMFGDDALCFIAKQLLGIFRHSDIIARYGGDEFVVFAPSLDEKVLKDRLQKLVDTLRYPYRSGTVEHNITLSIGAAVFPSDGADYDTLLDHADCALYQSKENGRNRFTLYEPYMSDNSKGKSHAPTSDDEESGGGV